MAKKRKKGIVGKLAAIKASIVAVPIVIKLIAIISIVCIGFVFFNYIKEWIEGKNTATEIYEQLAETQDFSELVEIKGDENEGYYWGFVDNIDEILQKIIEELEDNSNTVTIKDIDLLKKMILAEVVTQYPDLGGKSFEVEKSIYSGSSKQKAEQMMRDLSLEEKVSQMLFVLTSNNDDLSKGAGGYVLEGGFDFSRAQESISGAKNSVAPVFAVDEEGGTVQRVFDNYPSARTYGEAEDYEKLEKDYAEKSKKLLEMGINMNLAPVADVSGEGSFMKDRSFSSDYTIAGKFVEKAVKAMKSEGIITSLKHFPGYANAEDTHNGSYTDTREMEEVQKDINIFKKGINAGASTVMTSHITVDAIDPNNPASLSKKVINKIRGLGFDGVIITDALNMGALKGEKNIYVRAINAGNDVLEVNNFEEAKQQILNAIKNEEIKVSTINEAVVRILAMKFEYGILEGSDDGLSGDFVEDFLKAAQEVTDYARKNNFNYGHALYMPPKEDGTTDNFGGKRISCDRLVGWALYKCGYTDQPREGLTTSAAGSPLMRYCEEKGWKKIDNVEDVQAGDIVFSGQTNLEKTTAAHTFICAGDNKRYDCGSVERIRLTGKYSGYKSQPFNEPITDFICAYRVTTGSTGDRDISGEGGDQKVCELVESQLEKPYVVAGANPDIGFDCSGLFVWAFKEAGYDWGGKRLTADGFSKVGKEISQEELKPGDLICEGWSNGKYGHIVMYIGNDEVIGAEAVCSLPWNKHYSGSCISGCKVRKRKMTSDEKSNPTIKYITMAEYYKGGGDDILKLEDSKYNKTVIESTDEFQGAIHLRRVMPNKGFGEVKDVSTGVSVESVTYVDVTSNVGLGTKEDIPEDVKANMDGVSMQGLSGTSYKDLSYLTIPYYDFNGKIQKGNMVVKKELADEVLLIFQELYTAQYPIERMDTVEDFKSSMNSVDFGDQKDADYGIKLDITSMWYNNTSAFNDRNTSSGSSSNHSTGCAIDLNPKINPYVEENRYTPLNAEKYTKRDMSGWSEVEKKAVINKDSEIYKIFTKYGWSWGGDWETSKDYQHFEKTDLSKITKISSIEGEAQEGVNGNTPEAGENTSSGSTGGQIAGDGKQYVIAIDAGHGPAEGAEQGLYKTGTQDSSGANSGMVERDYTRLVADAIADKLSIYSNLKVVRIGNSAENPMVDNKQRVNMAKEAGADLYVTIHYNGSDNKSVSGTEVYYPAESGYPEDTASKQLAEILANSVSSSIGIKNRGVFDENVVNGLVIIKHSNLVGFPCVCVEGGYMSNKNDVNLLKGDEGVNRYAEGVAKGILEYCGLENKGFGQVNSSAGNVVNNAGIDSKIYDLKYVPPEKFQEHVEANDEQALREFTLDEDKKIVIATWSYNSNDGGLKISTKSFQTGKTYTQKYMMPMEYLLAYYIDTRNEEFVVDLANLAINSEFVLAIQDNVSTVKTEEFETTEVRIYEDNLNNLVSTDRSGPKKTSSVVTESVSTSVELTYGDTWFVKFYKDINYSSDDMNKRGGSKRVNTTQKIDGNVNNNETAYETSNTWTGLEDKIFTRKTKIKRTEVKNMSYKYNTGEMHVLGNEQDFITIYKKNREFRNAIKPEWLFMVLEQQPKTSNMVDLTKYLIYRARGQKDDYGITNFNFNEYAPESFTMVQGIYGNTVEEKVWFAFRSAGYSEEATAGVLGNMYQESNFIPDAARWYDRAWSIQYIADVDNGVISRESFARDGQGYGLVGWTWSKLKYGIYDYAKSKGTSIADVNTQIEFLLGAVNPNGGADGYAIYVMGNGMNGFHASDWENATTPEAAAEAYCWTFEKPAASGANVAVRKQKAREYYEQFKGMTAPTMGSDSRIGAITLSGENANKMMQMLVEALRIADDDRYTYSQSNRYGEFQYDCSSFVARLYKQYFNIDTPNNTGAYGSANLIGSPTSVQLQPGDVLWREGHVEIYIGNNQRVGAHTGKGAAADQISVKSYTPPGTFTRVYRFVQ